MSEARGESGVETPHGLMRHASITCSRLRPNRALSRPRGSVPAFSRAYTPISIPDCALRWALQITFDIRPTRLNSTPSTMPPSTSALSASTTTPRASSPAPSGSSDSDDDDLSFFYEKDENGLLVRHTKTPVTKTQTRTSTRNSGSGSGSGGEKRGYVPPASTHTRRSAELQAAEAAPVSRPMTRARSGSATVVQGATTGSRPMTRVKTAGPSSFKNDAQR